VAIADSFEPFPAAAPATATVASAAAPAPVAAAPSAPARPVFAATGLLFAPGRALSTVAAADCPNPTIDGKPAKFIRDDRESGLSLLSAESGSGPAVGAPGFGALGPDLVALSYAADEPDGRVALDVTSASQLAPGQGETRPRLLASLSKNAGGAPVFDRTGGLVAMIAQSTGEPRLVAGITPIAPHAFIGADQIQRFLALTPDASAASARGAPLGAGQIAAVERAYVVAISCRR
jgi:hypothetical protein